MIDTNKIPLHYNVCIIPHDLVEHCMLNYSLEITHALVYLYTFYNPVENINSILYTIYNTDFYWSNL